MGKCIKKFEFKGEYADLLNGLNLKDNTIIIRFNNVWTEAKFTKFNLSVSLSNNHNWDFSWGFKLDIEFVTAYDGGETHSMSKEFSNTLKDELGAIDLEFYFNVEALEQRNSRCRHRLYAWIYETEKMVKEVCGRAWYWDGVRAICADRGHKYNNNTYHFVDIDLINKEFIRPYETAVTTNAYGIKYYFYAEDCAADNEIVVYLFKK